MTKIDHLVIFLLLTVFLFMAAWRYPSALSDQNVFLNDFLDNDFLSVLGFITAITVASISSIHLHLNSLTDQTKKGFQRTKSALLKSAVTLIFSFALGLVLVVIKPIFPIDSFWRTICNCLALTVILLDLSIMLDVTRTVLKIPPVSEL